jgi:hypothetical protein
MQHYFFVLDGAWFHERLRPALAASWRKKSFQPCQVLCRELAASARAFAETYHVSADGSLVAAIAAGLPFDRNIWRGLVGEALLYGATEIPEIQTAVESLTCLLAPDRGPDPYGPREQFAPIHQAYFGSRDLRFGGGFYRPEQVGLNDHADVRRLSDYLATLDSAAWTIADLEAVSGLTDSESREAELEYLRECLPALCRLYERARDQGQVTVCERP